MKKFISMIKKSTKNERKASVLAILWLLFCSAVGVGASYGGYKLARRQSFGKYLATSSILAILLYLVTYATGYKIGTRIEKILYDEKKPAKDSDDFDVDDDEPVFDESPWTEVKAG